MQEDTLDPTLWPTLRRDGPCLDDPVQVEITCEEHDRQAASTQFVTHTVGRMLGAMEVRPIWSS